MPNSQAIEVWQWCIEVNFCGRWRMPLAQEKGLQSYHIRVGTGFDLWFAVIKFPDLRKDIGQIRSTVSIIRWMFVTFHPPAGLQQGNLAKPEFISVTIRWARTFRSLQTRGKLLVRFCILLDSRFPLQWLLQTAQFLWDGKTGVAAGYTYILRDDILDDDCPNIFYVLNLTKR